jgi:hypothetical protein
MVRNDFGPADEITNAKDTVVNEVDKILTDKWSKPARRREDSINKSGSEVNDILNVMMVSAPSFVENEGSRVRLRTDLITPPHLPLRIQR